MVTFVEVKGKNSGRAQLVNVTLIQRIRTNDENEVTLVFADHTIDIQETWSELKSLLITRGVGGL